jgi:alpha-beta hydrolase superfamily lysophospholipase
MFSRTDAENLRESLLPIDFKAANFQDSNGLLKAYNDHYGLNLTSHGLKVSHQIGSISSGQFKIVCHHFTIDQTKSPSEKTGTAFLVHGYFDHTGLYGKLIKHCLDSGYNVVTFDLPGHGLSSGPVASISSFHEYSQAYTDCLAMAKIQQLSRPWISIGQSTGAAVIVDALLYRNLATEFEIERYVLLCPLLRPHNWGWGRLMYAVSKWMPIVTRRTFSSNSHDREFLKFLKHDDALQSQLLSGEWVAAMIDYQRRFSQAVPITIPLGIVQGSGDRTVDWQYNLRHFLQKFPTSKSYLIADGRHHLVNESAEIRAQVFAAIDKILA